MYFNIKFHETCNNVLVASSEKKIKCQNQSRSILCNTKVLSIKKFTNHRKSQQKFLLFEYSMETAIKKKINI